MVEHLSRLFAYDAWANREVLAALQATPAPPERPLKFIAHILAAERLWLERLEGKKQTLPVWPEITTPKSAIEECAKRADELSLLWEKYLAASSEADLASSITYQNSIGETWSSRKDDVLMHVTMHSAYHRGQIAADMRSAGLKRITPLFVFQFCVVLVVILVIALRPGEWNSARWIGLAIAVPSAVLLSTARWQLGRSFSVTPQARVLVTGGIYSKIRNPIYVFSGLMILGVLIAVHYRYAFLLLAILIPLQIIRARQEAKVLEAKFEDEYLRYRESTWF